MSDPAPSSPVPIIEVTNLVRKFGERTVLRGLSFKVFKGDTMIIMGGSGCGKSTLLRHINGAMKPTSGSIKIFGEEITGRTSASSPTSAAVTACFSRAARCSSP